jgi:hypothetical protein
MRDITRKSFSTLSKLAARALPVSFFGRTPLPARPALFKDFRTGIFLYDGNNPEVIYEDS